MKVDHLLLYAADLSKTLSFYEALGFEVSQKNDTFIVVKAGDFELHCYDQAKVHFKQDVGREKGAGVFIYIRVPDVDQKFRELKSRGLQPSGEPKDWEWGNREFAIKDPSGYRIIFYKPIK